MNSHLPARRTKPAVTSDCEPWRQRSATRSDAIGNIRLPIIPRLAFSFVFVFLLLNLVATAGAGEVQSRRVLSLNGTWQIAEGKMDHVPVKFDHVVPVPGLVSLATPAFDPPPGPSVADRQHPTITDPAREAFWYRRTFHLDQPVPGVARLKVHKAMFGTRVLLNGQILGDHAPSFTPGYFDARGALRPGENVLLIRVGANLSAVPRGVATSRDFEKKRYIPGVFDTVELILSDTPHFLHVQTAPEIMTKTVRVQAVLGNLGPATHPDVTFLIREAESSRIVGKATQNAVACAAATKTTVDVRIPIQDCRLWSPENPFLYRLEVDSGTDLFTTRFGMREFKFDPASGRALLNGRPYFMRGSNFTLYRFFEDAECHDLPWQSHWVRQLHQRVKEMHWNCLRYCIGFPPEEWYEIADELGILIQDEFPVWGIDDITPDQLAVEYTEWMRERWNHPSVVIWDAQNETRSHVTGEALTQVRSLDLSNRPWDNGWAPPVAATDSLEVHPYHFGNPCFILDDLRSASRSARVGPPAKDTTNAIVINEYGWLWLNRDGTPTTLTSNLYRNLAGTNATAERRRHLYATYLAAETEFWRSYRQAAAVMHFNSLGYSRPDGQTSDHWLDVRTLQWEPEFRQYVRDAFAPVGLMMEFWRSTDIAGTATRIPVRLINDLDKPWSGAITLRLQRAAGGNALLERRQDTRLEPFGSGAVEFSFSWPENPGDYRLEAELVGNDLVSIRSVREMSLVDVLSMGLGFRKKASASSSASPAESPENAVDGDLSTYWVSLPVDPSWLSVDLGEARRVSRVRIAWGLDCSPEFNLQISLDSETWTDVSTSAGNEVSISDLRFVPVDARYVRVAGTKRREAASGGWPAAQRSHTIRELQVFE